MALPVAAIEIHDHRSLLALAREIMRSLIDQYKSNNNEFRDDQRKTGLIYRCVGSTALLLLLNGFADLAEEAEEHVAILRDIVIAEFKAILDHITKRGYDATPIVEDRVTSKLFSPAAGPKQLPYTDSLAWVLSTALQLRFAQRSGNFPMPPDLEAVLKSTIRDTLKLIVESAGPDGWGYTKGATSDLYYTYAVSEALADYGDYVLGESKDIAKADSELKQYLANEAGLLESLAQCRYQTAVSLFDKYNDVLGTSDVIPPNADNRSRHNLLYYSLFLIDLLIVSIPDDRLNPQEGDTQEQASAKAALRTDLYTKLEHGLYLTRIAFDRAYRDRAWFKDQRASSLKITWALLKDRPDFTAVARANVEEPGVVPLVLRCNALYSFYIAQGRDQKMSEMFRIVLENRNENGLWDIDSFDLIVTERAIEALVDYHDYVQKYEQAEPLRPLIRSGVESAIKELIASEIQAHLAAIRPHLSELPEHRAESNINDEVEKLNTILFAINSALKGEPDQNSPQVTAITGKNFCRIFSEFLFLLFLSRLTEQAGTEANPDTLSQQLEANSSSMLRTLGVKLSSPVGVDFEDMLNDVLDRLLKGRPPLKKGTP